MRLICGTEEGTGSLGEPGIRGTPDMARRQRRRGGRGGGGRPRNKGEKLLEKKRANRTNDDDTDTVLSRSIATLAMHMLKIDAAHRENLSPDVKTTTTFFFFFRCKKNCNR